MNKENSILAAVMHLIKNVHENSAVEKDQLTNNLEELGFQQVTIQKAIKWLSNLYDLEVNEQTIGHPKGIRLFSREEQQLFDSDSRDFLNLLEQQGVLSPFLREVVINQIKDLEQEKVDVKLIKWVTLMILFGKLKPGSSLSMQTLLILNEGKGGLH